MSIEARQEGGHAWPGRRKENRETNVVPATVKTKAREKRTRVRIGREVEMCKSSCSPCRKIPFLRNLCDRDS